MTEPPDDAAALRRVLDELAVAQLVATYASGIDRKDLALVLSCFEPGAYVNGANGQGVCEEFYGAMFDQLADYPVSFHFVGNQRRSLDGDAGWTETYCTAYHFSDEAGTVEAGVFGTRYRDEVRRGDDGVWRIHRRDSTIDWSRL
jgi:SnoaL-like domain